MSRMDNGHSADDRVNAHLRQRFLVWSVAIASSLTSSGMVSLRPSAAWAQEEPATAVDQDAKPEAQAFDREKFTELLREKNFAEAGQMLDAALAEEPDNALYTNLNMSLAMSMRGSQPDAALERLRKQYEALLELENLANAQASSLAMATTYLTSLNREATVEEQLGTIDAALEKLQEVDGPQAEAGRFMLGITKARLLLTGDRSDEAKQVLDSLLGAAREQIVPKDAASSQTFLSVVSNYASLLAGPFPEAVAEVEQEAENLALKLLDQEQVGVAEFVPYFNLKAGAVSRLLYSKPSEAEEILDALEDRMEALKEELDPAEATKLSRLEQQLRSTRTRLEAALAREALIGTEAPELDAESYVAMEEVSMEDLKGKVVLLDFWAVWCGPCIATFPHLIEWKEKYGSEGLEIVGVTKLYGYGWDEESGRPQRSEDVTAEEELAMLEKFRESYDLQHGFVVTPKDSEYFSKFLVTGIPQAVLLDKEGKIQMIRVGSSEENAKALQSKIEELLGS